jgi:TonB family protein
MFAWIILSALPLGAAAQDTPTAVQVFPPALPLMATTGGEVLLKASVTPAGFVQSVDVLKHSPGFSEALQAAVRRWRLGPPGPGEDPSGRQVLVAGMFRPPTLMDVATPAPPGPLSADSAAVPIPTRWERPPFPPRAVGDGIVILEASVGTDGSVEDMAVVLGSPAFDSAARDTARRWVFRPAVREGQPVESVAYLVFVFRQPLTPPLPPR